MALTQADLDAVRAQWAEWVADGRFKLEVSVVEGATTVEVLSGSALGLRLSSGLECRIQIWQLVDRPSGAPEAAIFIFDERIPPDPSMLRASVAALARALAERHADEQPGGDESALGPDRL